LAATCFTPDFKYAGFAQASLADLLGNLGVEVHWRPWQILLPVGISFYIFQAMSYVIDVYRRQLTAQRNLVDFMSYVAFFPQLVAGPIERATNLLPQLKTTRRVSLRDIELGMWLILWGLFKKVAVADQLGPLVVFIYDNPNPTAPLIILAVVATSCWQP
jgi:D-alanyl-lipoteichoic acid acyltransferase DltB (MBOAT superfamily)